MFHHTRILEKYLLKFIFSFIYEPLLRAFRLKTCQKKKDGSDPRTATKTDTAKD